MNSIRFREKNKKFKFYNTWQSMKRRCFIKKHSHYKIYGGRGITICEKWHDFQNFYNDMFPDYCEHAYQFGERNTQIDRIDNNGNYEFENCR